VNQISHEKLGEPESEAKVESAEVNQVSDQTKLRRTRFLIRSKLNQVSHQKLNQGSNQKLRSVN
jgi:hypothetical protein